ncbi:deaminase [bacterium]|nr:deaminase [bacterium]|tara:strand:- start:13079 stop:13771 length:693 start_codon:yes stop_codon:yes gene_type:complete
MERPETTLFMLMSVDGKISTGDTDAMDVDKDFLNVDGVKEGLKQYYDIEQTTDPFSLNSGRVFEKIGVNEKKVFQDGIPVSFVVVDNKPHLTSEGIEYLAEKTRGVFVVSTNANHPAKILSGQNDKITFLLYNNEIDFQDVLYKLKKNGADKLTIQSGGTLNSVLLRAGLIDHLSIVVAPILVGGKNTATLIDGESLHNNFELMKLRPLTLVSCKQLEHSYLHLKYDVKN